MQLATFAFFISLTWIYSTKSLIHVLQSPVQQGDPYLWQQQKKLEQSFGWFKCQHLNPVINEELISIEFLIHIFLIFFTPEKKEEQVYQGGNLHYWICCEPSKSPDFVASSSLPSSPPLPPRALRKFRESSANRLTFISGFTFQGHPKTI